MEQNTGNPLRRQMARHLSRGRSNEMRGMLALLHVSHHSFVQTKKGHINEVLWI